jgi:hypothetical protein
MCFFFMKSKKYQTKSEYIRNSRYAIQGVAYVGSLSVIFIYK